MCLAGHLYVQILDLCLEEVYRWPQIESMQADRSSHTYPYVLETKDTLFGDV